MQTIQLIIFVAFVLSRAAASISSFSDPTSIVNIDHDANRLSRALAAGQNQTQRSLRQHEGEDRGAIDKADEVVSKMKALMGTAKNAPNNLAALIAKRSKTAGEFVRRPFLVSKLSKRYNFADQLSFSTLKQLDKIENMRIVDIKNGIKGNKKTPNGMRRKIKHFEGMKTAPQKFLESHVGRDMQRFGKDGRRWLSAGVVTRTTDQGERQILLISSSNPAKGDFLLPKGGWDRGEKIKKATLREVMEEGGVNAQLAHGLGKIKFSEVSAKGKDPVKYKYFGYLMRSSTVYDDWSESFRYRLWVTYDDAIKMLAGRPQMVELVKRAKYVDDLIASGKLPEVNPKLAEVKLDLN